MLFALRSASARAVAATLLLLGISLLPLAVRGQATASGKELVAVLDLDALGASKNQVAAVSERLREELLATGNYRLVDRAQMDKVLDEQALQQTGCTSQECAVQVGRILGVRKLITGKVNRVEGGLWLISCTLIDAESAEISRAVSFQHQGDFASLLTQGAPELVGKLTGGVVATAAVARSPRIAPATLIVPDMTPETRVFLNGSEKGKGSQKFTDLAPGPYNVGVRRAGYRPFQQTVNLAAGQTVSVKPEFERFRVAMFPIRRSGNWNPKDDEEFTTGWVTRAMNTALSRTGLVMSHSVHVDHPRSKASIGTDLGDQPDVLKSTWSFLGNPDTEFARSKGKALGADAVLLVSVSTGTSEATGGWKAKLVNVSTGAVIDDSGTWPYGPQAGPQLAVAVEPVLAQFIGANQ